jgi:hypothetical protein
MQGERIVTLLYQAPCGQFFWILVCSVLADLVFAAASNKQ